VADGAATRWRPYRVILGSRLRSQATYRTSFVLDVVGSVGFGIVEFTEVYVIFTNITALGGLGFGGVVLMFALANISLSLADLMVGHLDTVSDHIRQGTLDAFLLRPLSVLGQLATGDVQLRRLGRTAVGVVMFVVGVGLTDIEWGGREIALIALALASGVAIFAALFVCAAAMQFWLIDGRPLANAFTHGGSYAASYPASIYTLPLRVAFTFVIPAAFVGYLPTLALLNQPGPALLPTWLGWCTPVAAAAIWAVALLWWRAGLRHYTGAGS
jgi:ABC-2 type transport system permease protein